MKYLAVSYIYPDIKFRFLQISKEGENLILLTLSYVKLNNTNSYLYKYDILSFVTSLKMNVNYLLSCKLSPNLI